MQAGAVHIEHHAVVATTNPALFYASIFETGAAVDAVRVEQPDPTALVAEGNQFFAQDLQKVWCVGEFSRQAHWMPETAHVLAHGGARTRLRQLWIVFGDLVGVVAAVGLHVRP